MTTAWRRMRAAALLGLCAALTTLGASCTAAGGDVVALAPNDLFELTFVVNVVNLGTNNILYKTPAGTQVTIKPGGEFPVQFTAIEGQAVSFTTTDFFGDVSTNQCTLENAGEVLFVPREYDFNPDKQLFHCISWQ